MAMLFTAQLPQVDASGDPYSGAKLYFYQTGTTTAITTYQDSAAGTPHASPVVANSKGEFAPIYVATNTFKVVLTDSSDVTVRTIDPVNITADEMFGISGDIKDDEIFIVDPADTTKKVRIDAGSVGAGATRVLTMPNENLDLSGLTSQAQGDIIYRGASSWQRLAIGTAGQTLRVNSGATAPAYQSSWETIAGPTSFTTQSQIDWTDLSAFWKLRLSCYLTASTDSVAIKIRVSTDNGSSFDATNGNYRYASIGQVLATGTDAAGNDTGFGATTLSTVGNATGEYLHFVADFMHFNMAASCSADITAVYVNASSNEVHERMGHQHVIATARDALRLVPASGTISGIYFLEGIRA